MIAISYRREDSLPITSRLYDRLCAEFGRAEVFMDFDSIPYGMDFRAHIKQTLERASVVIAVIGPSWAGQQSNSIRRIDDPRDFVRLEIAAALDRGIPIIPVLVNDAPMPAAEGLPTEIEALAFRNGLELDSGIDFHHHADRLITGVRDLLEKGPRSSRVLGARAKKKRHSALSRSIAAVAAGTGAAVLIYLGMKDSPPISNQPDASSTPNATAVPSAADEEQVRQLIRDYYSAFARRDIDSVIAAFADIVDYQGQGRRDKKQIRAEAEAYLLRWDKILFAVEDINVSRMANGDFAASFSVSFSVQGRLAISSVVRGVSVNNWVLHKDPLGHFHIVFQREKVQSPGKG